MMLLRLGIVSRFRIVRKRYKGDLREYGQITVLCSSLNKFSDIIGFNVEHKQSRLNNILQRKRNTNLDVIPSVFGSILLRRYYRQLPKSVRRKKLYQSWHYYMAERRSMSYDKLSKIYNKYKECCPDKEIEQTQVCNAIKDVFHVLTDEQQIIINLAYGIDGNKPISINKICQKFDITRLYCTKIINSALSAMKDHIKI